MGLFDSIFNRKKSSRHEMSQSEVLTKTEEPPKMQETQAERWFSVLHTDDLPHKFKVLKELSDEGFAVAQLDLGGMYMRGEYVEEDWETARELFMQCYEECPYASLWIGMMGVHPEKFRVQREDQLAEAFYFLSVAAGKGIEEAFAEVYSWWHRLDQYGDRNWIAGHFEGHLSEIIAELEERSDEKALDTIGLFYQFGVYYEQDLAKAKEYFERSAALNPTNRFSSARRHLENPIFDLLDEDEE